MRTRFLTAGVLLVVAVTSGCDHVRQATAQSRPARAPFGVAGNCPSGAGPMQPTIAGAEADRNRDGYVCVKHAASISGDRLRFHVDNDAAAGRDAASVEVALYAGM